MDRKWWTIAIIALTALTLACGGGGSSSGNATPLASGGSTQATAVPAANAVGKVGERVEQGGIVLTVTKVEKTDKLSDFQKAKDGSTFVVAEVLIENAGQDNAPYNPLYFKVKDSEGFEANASLGVNSALASGELAKGEKARGMVAFEVKQAAKGLVLEYRPLVIGSDTTIKVALE